MNMQKEKNWFWPLRGEGLFIFFVLYLFKSFAFHFWFTFVNKLSTCGWNFFIYFYFTGSKMNQIFGKSPSPRIHAHPADDTQTNLWMVECKSVCRPKTLL